MNARTRLVDLMKPLDRWSLFFPIVLAVTVLGLLGCSGKADVAGESSEEPYAASQTNEGNAPAIPNLPEDSLNEQAGGNNRFTPANDAGGVPVVREVTPGTAMPSRPDDEGSSANPANTATPFSVSGAGDSVDETAPQTLLRPDMTPDQLWKYLSDADVDMQKVFSGRSGIQDPAKAKKTLTQIVKGKLEASRRLANHPDADPATKMKGRRGELQALSHLASLGDVSAAEELETLAREAMQSEDPSLAADSRLVVLGFAIESLHAGDEDAPDRIVELAKQIEASPTQPDVAALMTLGEARQSLQVYEHDEQAKAIRNLIISLFADSENPQVAEMAAQMAGNIHYDEIDRILTRILGGEAIESSTWQDAVKKLLQDSADLQSVRYLAGAMLEFESMGRSELIDATFESLETTFADSTSATGQEVQTAKAAYAARQTVIGNPFEFDLPAVAGQPFRAADLKGKVVLLPFWSMNFPPSLQPLATLQAIKKEHPDDVEIVGINLDPPQAPIGDFLKQNDLEFISLQGANSEGGPSPIAAEFGVVSMPFIVVIDREGRVAAIHLASDGVRETVGELIKSK